MTMLVGKLLTIIVYIIFISSSVLPDSERGLPEGVGFEHYLIQILR